MKVQADAQKAQMDMQLRQQEAETTARDNEQRRVALVRRQAEIAEVVLEFARAAQAQRRDAIARPPVTHNRAAGEQRLHSFLEGYYGAPARVLMARQATYAGPVEGCVEWLQRWIDAGARHISLRFAGGDQLAQLLQL